MGDANGYITPSKCLGILNVRRKKSIVVFFPFSVSTTVVLAVYNVTGQSSNDVNKGNLTCK